jgi:hypothetical protein
MSWFCWRLDAAEFCSTASWLHVHFSWLTFPDFSGGPSPDCDNRQGPATYHDPPLVFDLDEDPQEAKPVPDEDGTLGERAKALLKGFMADVAQDKTHEADFSTDPNLVPCCNSAFSNCRCSERWSELSKISGFQSLIGVLVCQVLLSWRWFIREICCVLNFKQSCDRISFHWGSFSRRKPRLLL